MRVDVAPRWIEVQPQQPIPLAVTISNPGTVIGGYALRILGADPDWVSLDTDQLTLFPDETRTILVTLTLPAGMPAGVRRVAVQVRGLAPPFDTAVTEVDLSVPEAEAVQVRVEPITVTAGSRAVFSVVVTNTGNTTLLRVPAGDDAENRAEVLFAPSSLTLPPGQHAVLDLRVKARRPWVGSPAIRVLNVYLDPGEPERGARPSKARDERTALATATLIQRPLLSRGVLSLAGLLVAATVFALVISTALTQVTTQSAADRDLAIQVANAQNLGAGSGGSSTGSIKGTVTNLTSGDRVEAVTVDLFAASSSARPVVSGITDRAGHFTFTGLAFGDYKLSFHGAGVTTLWYPAAATDADATPVTVSDGQASKNLTVVIRGVPGTVEGKVTGDDVSIATLQLRSVKQPSGILRTVPIGADGAFSLTDVPTPASYEIVVSKPEYANATQLIRLDSGQNLRGLQLRLIRGDGQIEGTIGDLRGPLSGASLTATSGQTSTSTVSLTSPDTGKFTLRNLPTPGTYTIVATARDHASQTQIVTLAAGQHLDKVQVTLVTAVGELTGKVEVATKRSATTLTSLDPSGGITVTVTDGQRTVRTVTASQRSVRKKGSEQHQVERGEWRVSGLPIPGTYTVTFSRPDLESTTVGVQMTTDQNVPTVSMRLSTASLYGTIRPAPGKTLGPATVTVRSASASYSMPVTSIGKKTGFYRIDRIPPGTYTVTATASSGIRPASAVLALAPGDVTLQDFTLQPAATLTVVVTGSDNVVRVGWTVTLFLESGYPDAALATLKTNAQGNVKFNDLDSGSYLVEVRPPNGTPVKTGRWTVESSTNYTLEIRADRE